MNDIEILRLEGNTPTVIGEIHFNGGTPELQSLDPLLQRDFKSVTESLVDGNILGFEFSNSAAFEHTYRPGDEGYTAAFLELLGPYLIKQKGGDLLPPQPCKKLQTILVVDSYPVFREALMDLLNLHWYPLEAASAEEALEKLALQPIDLVVSDINLPAASGFWLLEHIQKLHRQVPLLFLTTDDQCSSVVRAFELGARGYLAKKAGTDELIRAIIACHSGKNYLDPTMAHCLANPSQERVRWSQTGFW